MDCNPEQFLSGFGMVCQSAIREPEFIRIVLSYGVHHSASVQGVEPDMPNQDGDHRTGCDRSALRKELDPPKAKLRPLLQGELGTFEDRLTRTEHDCLLIAVE